MEGNRVTCFPISLQHLSTYGFEMKMSLGPPTHKMVVLTITHNNTQCYDKMPPTVTTLHLPSIPNPTGHGNMGHDSFKV